jgi:Glycosyl transferase family 2
LGGCSASGGFSGGCLRVNDDRKRVFNPHQILTRTSLRPYAGGARPHDTRKLGIREDSVRKFQSRLGLLQAMTSTRSLAGAPKRPQLRRQPTVSAIVPARNEALCIGAVVSELLALRTASGAPLVMEVVVADNGSTDGTAQLAWQAGARVVDVPQAGYGRACWEAVQASSGDCLLFVDGDGAAVPDEAEALLLELARGADLVIGVRCRIEAQAMSLTQRFGNGLACFLMRLIWRMPAADLGPYRAIHRDAFDALKMQDRSFGWTVEMQVRAHVSGLRATEVPVTWRARTAGTSKISGTLRGAALAGVGILGMIARLWWRERARAAAAPHVPAQAPVSSPIVSPAAPSQHESVRRFFPPSS